MCHSKIPRWSKRGARLKKKLSVHTVYPFPFLISCSSLEHYSAFSQLFPNEFLRWSTSKRSFRTALLVGPSPRLWWRSCVEPTMIRNVRVQTISIPNQSISADLGGGTCTLRTMILLLQKMTSPTEKQQRRCWNYYWISQVNLRLFQHTFGTHP